MDETRRRTLSLAILAAAALLLVAGVAVYLVRGAEARSAYLALVVVLLLLGLAQAYLLFAKRVAQAMAPKEEYLLADESPVLEEDVYDVKCGSCGTEFRVPDTLQRPLLAHCPVCGAEGIVPLRRPAKEVRLRCPRCQRVNAVADDGSRPLRARCAGCSAMLAVR